ncbi:non-ribosomal peptide synthetase [Brevibacillus laterosporus]|uniref:non-ribosomal peptide synthetase n=1 Tax=Brevibacillus laterosporus TaxID=1465 RepID=UPI00264CD239|nr:amino acid adenylation domain-containing protein [Brevibacillus laterosporus]MDN9009954.1 amino acid adenylation domain-containing protein [Brevibacillus laterosporus]MDO0940664.1 amino acid adenylation domain-containing protein [Brevibacillus laterosporus]
MRARITHDARFVHWKREWDFWREKSTEDVALSAFPTDGLSLGRGSNRTAYFQKTFTHEMSNRLCRLSGGSDYTLFTVLLAAVKALLAVYTAQPTVVVGMPVFRQNDPKNDFINCLVLVTATRDDDLTCKQWLQQVKGSLLEANDHQNIPFQAIAELFSFNKAPDSTPICPTVVRLDSIQEKDYTKLVATGLQFHFLRQPDQITLELEYQVECYSLLLIKQIAGHLEIMISKMLSQPDDKLSEFSLLTQAEENTLLHRDTKCDFPRDKTIHQLFENQVTLHPERIAVWHQGKSISYKELNQKANQLARRLQHIGIAPEDRVALLLDRSPLMVIAILAVLKAGGAYVPIDPHYPESRISYMVADSGATLLLTTGECITDQLFDCTVLDVEAPEIYRGNNENILCTNTSHRLAYIIYTSGTTGKPKGVMIEHRQVVQLIRHTPSCFDFNERDVWSMFHSYCFDFSVWEMYGALLYGGELVLVPTEVVQNPAKFAKLLIDRKVTILNQTPKALYALQDEMIRLTKLEGLSPQIRYMILGGEALQPMLLRPWQSHYPSTRLINMYGITETTVHVTYKELTDEELITNRSNIGVPLPTLSCYLFDSKKRLVPMGVTGELYIGGHGVGRGYMNRADLTRDRFIFHPYKTEDILYRTGDLARYLPNGELEYLGRSDQQVKIRGYRLELGEIETAILSHPDVRESLVLTINDKQGDQALCAYVVRNGELDDQQLRTFLTKKLPAYMLPSYLVFVREIPITSNGKADRSSLPSPQEVIREAGYIAPRNHTEEKVAKIWQDVLGIAKVGVADHFFTNGGNSLNALKLIGHISQEWGMEVPLALLFESPTVEAIARYLDHQANPSDQQQLHAYPEMITFHAAKEQSIFLFPPVLGYGIMYNRFASQFNHFRVHAFDFMESENRISRYVEMIEQMAPTDTLVLGGFSAGGNLAFEVVKALEEQGRSVSLLLLIDSYRKLIELNQPSEEREKTVQSILEANHEMVTAYLDIHRVRDGLVNKTKAYHQYYEQLINKGKIAAPICLLKSESITTLPAGVDAWNEATTTSYTEQQGIGQHEEMLQVFAKQNAQLLQIAIAKALTS